MRWPRGDADTDAAPKTVTTPGVEVVPEAPAGSDLPSFVALNYPRLVGLAGLICLDIGTAELIVQRTLREVWTRRWPRRAMTRTRWALDRTVARAALRPAGVAAGGGHLGRFVAAPRVVPLRVAAGPADGLTSLAGAFETLTARQRALLSLVYHGGYRPAEATQLLGRRRGAGRGDLQVGRERLRRALGSAAAAVIPEDQLDLTIERYLAERAAEVVRYAVPAAQAARLLAVPPGSPMAVTRQIGSPGARTLRRPRPAIGLRAAAALTVLALVVALGAGYLVVGPYRPAVGGYLRSLHLIDTLAWSPDGSQLAFTVDDSTLLGPWPDPPMVDLYVVGVDGAAPRRLKTHMALAMEPRWSPSGRELLITDRSGSFDRLQVLDVASGAVRALPSPGEGATLDGRWSPDGAQILFMYAHDWKADEGWWSTTDLWLMNADGAALRAFASFGDAGNAQWSPDGRWVLFSRSGQSENSLMVARADGSSMRALQGCCDGTWWPDSSYIRVADWGERGNQVAFTEESPYGAPTIALKAPDDNGQWSPDGRFFASLALPSSGPRPMVFLADGRPEWLDPAQITSPDGPTWSPDSQAITFTGSGPEGSGLYVLRMGDAVAHLVLPYTLPWSGSSVAWRPGHDGARELAVTSGADVVLVGAEGHGARLLARAPAPDAPEGAPYLAGGPLRTVSLPMSMSIDGHGPNGVAFEVRGGSFWVTNGSASPWILSLDYPGSMICPEAPGVRAVSSDRGGDSCVLDPGTSGALEIGAPDGETGGALAVHLVPGQNIADEQPLTVYLRLAPGEPEPALSQTGLP